MKKVLISLLSFLFIFGLLCITSFDFTVFAAEEDLPITTNSVTEQQRDEANINSDTENDDENEQLDDSNGSTDVVLISSNDTPEENEADSTSISYQAHVENIGWQEEKSDGETAGTEGQSLRVEAIAVSFGDADNVEGGIQYRSHIQNVGWESEWHQDGEISGTTGQSLRLEAIQIKLYGAAANQYNVYYRVHVQNLGWLDWACNGEYAGSSGFGYRLEAFEILLYALNNSSAPQTNNDSYYGVNGERNYNYVSYQTHVQNIGWQDAKSDGTSSGTEGQSLRLEGIVINKGEDLADISGEIQYKVHVQNQGWEENWHVSGEVSGTTGQSLRLEAIQIQTTDDLAAAYDVYYRVHVQDYGWLDWACNGEESGSEGLSLRLEAIQILFQKKGRTAPGETNNAFIFDKTTMINNAIASLPKYIDTYYTTESATELTQLINKAKDAAYIEKLKKAEIQELISDMIEASKQLEYKMGTTAPVVYIATDSGIGNYIGKSDGYITTNIAIVDTKGKTLEDSGKIKVRGNSTAVGEKKPFTIKFDEKQNVLAMGKAKKWALLANLYDPTGVRNAVAFDLAQKMGLAYTSEYRFVELYVDGVYKGVYTLTEPVEAGKTRVDIDVDKGDFLIEREGNRTEEDVTYITLDCGLRFAINEPEEPTEAQVSQIKDHLNHIVSVMQNGTYEQLVSVVDIDSFAKYYILNELLKTVDFDYSSTRFYFKNGKLYAGPVWDYDMAMGNLAVSDSRSQVVTSTEGCYVNTRNLYAYMFNHNEFLEYASNIYKQYKDYITEIYAANGLIDSIIDQYADIIGKNNVVWDPTKNYSVSSYVLDSFGENIDFLRNWLRERSEWMSSYFNQKMLVMYYTHVANLGWTEWQSDGLTGGTTGRSLSMEAIRIDLSDNLTGEVLYKTYIYGQGWETEWHTNDSVSGTTGRGLPIIAIQIKLNGEIAETYDVTYQVHLSNIGWIDWACNGETAGMPESGNAIEAIRIKLVKKNLT